MSYHEELVSVIVPIYNVEDQLKKCINSILRQSYRNIEVILVDDGSPDRAPEICDDYAKKDKRVSVIHKANGGLSDARNAGIAAASGEYVSFIDSDDYIAPTFIQTLYEACLSAQADISCCNFVYVQEGTEKITHRLPKADKVFTREGALQDIFLAGSSCEVMTWNKLYRTSLFKENNIEFPIGKIHEDTLTTYKLFLEAKVVSYTDVELYYYLQRKGSIMSESFNSRRLDVLAVFDDVDRALDTHGISMKDEVQSFRLLVTLGLFNGYLAGGRRDPHVGSILKYALQDIGYVYGNRLISHKHKLLLSLARSFPLAYRTMRRQYNDKRKRI